MPFHDEHHVYPYAQVILVPPMSGNAELHPILFVVCSYFVAIGIESSQEIPRHTRVVAAVASPASGYPLAPTMARGLQPIDHTTYAEFHVRTRGAGDVPDGNDALWSFQEFLEPNATTMGTCIFTQKKYVYVLVTLQRSQKGFRQEKTAH